MERLPDLLRMVINHFVDYFFGVKHRGGELRISCTSCESMVYVYLNVGGLYKLQQNNNIFIKKGSLVVKKFMGNKIYTALALYILIY